jgi:hypothetical protein
MLKISIGVEDVAKLLSFYAEKATGKHFDYRMESANTAYVQSPGSTNFYEINHGGSVITEHNFKRNDDVLHGFGYKHSALVNLPREYDDSKYKDHEEEMKLYTAIEFHRTDNVVGLVDILNRMQKITDSNKLEEYKYQLKKRYSISMTENASEILNEGINRAAMQIPDVELTFTSGKTYRDMYKQEMKNYFL